MSWVDEAERLRISDQLRRDEYSRRPNSPAQGNIVRVGQVVAGLANDIQTVRIVGTPDGGTLLLRGRTIPFNATSAQVQAELSVAFGSGNVTCTGGPFPGQGITATFKGTLLNTAVPTMKGSGENLTGDAAPYEVRVEHVQRGEPAASTAARAYYRIQGLRVGGTEANGSPGAYTTIPVFWYALNLGYTKPPLNSIVVTTRVDSGYVFRY